MLNNILNQNLSCIYNGIVISTNPPTEEYPFLTYNCLVDFGIFGNTIVYRVKQSSFFGSINNNIFTSLQISDALDDAFESSDLSLLDTTRASYVLISFIAGRFNDPIIVGYIPNPNTISPITSDSTAEATNTLVSAVSPLPETNVEIKPQFKFTFNGIEAEINEVGEFKLTHYGLPANYNDDLYEPTENDVETPEREESTENKTDKALIPIIPQLSSEIVFEPKEDSDTQSFQDKAFITGVGFLETGEFYISDNLQQQLLFDQNSSTITLTNQNEIIQLDKENSKIFVYSSKDIEMYAGENMYINTDKSMHILVNESLFSTINENANIDILKNFTFNVKENVKETIEKDTDILFKGAYYKLSSDKKDYIEIKNGDSINLQSSDNKTKCNITQGTIKLTSDQTSVQITNDGITITDKNKDIITISNNEITIKSNKTINLQTTECNLKASKINLGGQNDQVPLGNALLNYISQHTHSTPVGVSSPPVVPPTKALLSNVVKLK